MRGSGAGGVAVGIGDLGQRAMTFASMRWGSSMMTVWYWRLGRSGLEGGDQPG